MPDAGFSVDLVYDGNDLSAESSADCEFSNFLFFFGIFGIKKLLPNFELPLAEGWAQIKKCQSEPRYRHRHRPTIESKTIHFYDVKRGRILFVRSTLR